MRITPVPSTPADHGSADITDAEAEALARAVVNLFRVWSVTDSEACILLGNMSPGTWTGWQRGEFGIITGECRHRMATLLSIHKGLRHLFVDPKRGYAWMRKANAAFDNASALDVMLRGEASDLARVRDYLSAECS